MDWGGYWDGSWVRSIIELWRIDTTFAQGWGGTLKVRFDFVGSRGKGAVNMIVCRSYLEISDYPTPTTYSN